jgi:hypothetical protein
MDNHTTAFYSRHEEPLRSCLLALRDIMLDIDKHMTAEWKYGMPFFYYKGKMFAYLWINKKTLWPYISLSDGWRLTHPALQAENRSRFKVLYIDPEKDIPIGIIREILRSAMSFYA